MNAILPILRQRLNIDCNTYENLAIINNIYDHILAGKSNNKINYFELASLYMKSVSELGIVVNANDQSDIDEKKWMHTNTLMRGNGFRRHTAHHGRHLIEQIPIFNNLYLFGTKTHETRNKLVRHAVKHRMPAEIYSHALTRYNIFSSIIIYLQLGGSFNIDGCMCLDGAIKLPKSYIHSFNKEYDSWNCLSKLIEFKYHPSSLFYIVNFLSNIYKMCLIRSTVQ